MNGKPSMKLVSMIKRQLVHQTSSDSVFQFMGRVVWDLCTLLTLYHTLYLRCVMIDV